jgi:SAM-dependent methyltransferase
MRTPRPTTGNIPRSARTCWQHGGQHCDAFYLDPPAGVLDAGAGTGFVSLMLADGGYQVTAVDLSAQMLAVLRSKADRLRLNIRTLHADAAHPPSDETFDAVVERHLIRTLPEPDAVLAAWRDAAPAGRVPGEETMIGSGSATTGGEARLGGSGRRGLLTERRSARAARAPGKREPAHG